VELEEAERETVICIVPPLQTLERDRSIFESFVKIDGRGRVARHVVEDKQPAKLYCAAPVLSPSHQAVDRRYRKISPYSLSSAVRAPIIKV
jgi:hypothetical protein